MPRKKQVSTFDRKRECLGCGGTFMLRRNERRPICLTCRKNKDVFQQAVYRYERMLDEERMHAQAARETEGLPRRDTFTPIMGERAVEMMLRGDW